MSGSVLGLIDLEGIDPDFVIDPERRTVTVGTGARDGTLPG
jgi:hypothetical protein